MVMGVVVGVVIVLTDHCTHLGLLLIRSTNSVKKSSPAAALTCARP
jgi:hypothetical protein